MEYIIGLIILFILGKVFIKLLPIIWFIALFVIALIVLLIWFGILESTGLGIVFGVFGAIGGAWAFAKKSRSK